MADESFKTYQEVINYLKEKKRKINLLVGNGFSMAFDPTIFSYNALSNFIKSCKDQTILKLFRIVDSTNFELIMRELDLFPCGFNTPLLAANPHRKRFCVRLGNEPCTVGRNTVRLASRIA